MTIGIRAALAFLIGGLIALSAGAGQYDPTLQYQRRGDRVEGLRTIDVGGFDVELLSVRIDSPEVSSTQTWADRLRARFYLLENARLYLTVRQLRPQSTPRITPTRIVDGHLNHQPADFSLHARTAVAR
jgi:hypothetical protein